MFLLVVHSHMHVTLDVGDSIQFLTLDFELGPCMDRFKQIDCSGFVFSL